MTVTLKVPVDVLPDESVAVQLTVVVPPGNRLPEGGTQVIVGGPALSVAVAVYVTGADADPNGAVTVISAGTVSTGASRSTTVTSNMTVVVPVGPAASHVVVVVPTPSDAGDVGAHDTESEGPVKRIVALAVPGDVSAITTAPGPRRTGSALLGTQSRAAWISA
ncbi:MAG: hypothetical protein M3P38_13545 [Chloroflexota bacterium]|nr:hypothetical protein [Chloroflexota bacterium]